MEKSWKKFIKTGKVEDYLKYKEKQREKSNGNDRQGRNCS